ncbi:hypothetical protein BGW38_004971, partial [Lunasporangiospora selenospora]
IHAEVQLVWWDRAARTPLQTITSRHKQWGRCVKLARHRKTNEQVAIKIIPKAALANRAAVHRGIEREIAIMKLINHPHVIRLYDVYETEQELFLVMEYVSGGELFEYLVNKGRLNETEALRFFQQIIVGLAFCHKRKICHRDLKPENLLLDDQLNVKIADFGMASLQKSGRLLETSCGSPHYASPEVVTGLKYDGSSSDIWSCGIILYALLTGHLPFDDENIRQLLSKVKSGKFYMPTDISPGARDLISRMLTVNPKRRITMQAVLAHPWFRTVDPEHNILGEPAQDPETGRSLLPDELDAEIILHMRWLLAPGPSHSDPDAKEVFSEEALLTEIQDKMASDEENMEKLFYHLLSQHKTELLENYTGDDSDSVPVYSSSKQHHTNGTTDPVQVIQMKRGYSPTSMHVDESSAVTKDTGSKEMIIKDHPVGRHSSCTWSIGTSRRGSSESEMERTHKANVLEKSKDDTKRREPHDRVSIELISTTSATNSASNCSETGTTHSMTSDSGASALLPLGDGEDTKMKAVRNATETSTDRGGSADIENQVISTQIAENIQESNSSRSGDSQRGSGTSGKTVAEVEVNQEGALNGRTLRPTLYPLDLKTSAGAMVTNGPTSRHSRKYSDGTSNISPCPQISPSAPKRPWFARLFDFKPQ